MNIVTQRPEPADPQSVKKLKRQASSVLAAAQISASRIKMCSDEVGKAQLESDLGGDSAELVALYGALSTLILALDPDADVPAL